MLDNQDMVETAEQFLRHDRVVKSRVGFMVFLFVVIGGSVLLVLLEVRGRL